MDFFWRLKELHTHTYQYHLHSSVKNRSILIPTFHCFTGCDTTSAFGRGKKSAQEPWKAYPDVTEAFLFMVSHQNLQTTAECQHFQLLERFSAVLYDKTRDVKFVNETWRELFC